MSRNWKLVTPVLVWLLAGTPAIAAAQSSPDEEATYRWLGELVSVDKGASTMTVKSRVAYEEAMSELAQLAPGENVWIVWSGVRDYSDAVRQVRRSQPGAAIGEDLVLPAELVSTDVSHRYVTIRVTLPDNGVAALEAVKPGEWITVTSRHRPSADAEAVVAVAPYGAGAT